MAVDLERLRPRLTGILVRATRVLSGPYSVAQKGHSGADLVTSKDLELQAHLFQELTLALPGSQAVGEEGFIETALPSTKEPVWLVDPLDGTVNFAHGVPFYGISVALYQEGAAILAGVVDAKHGHVFSAIKAGGAFIDDQPLNRPIGQSKLIALSSGLIADLARNSPSTLQCLLETHKLRNLGSQALQLCYAAAGIFQFVASREAKGWDDAAGALIAQECGLTYGSYRPAATVTGDDQYSLCAPEWMFDDLSNAFAKSISLEQWNSANKPIM